MAKTTLAFGIVLIVLGVVGYLASGAASPTALIPAGLGVVLLLLGLLARDPGKRKLAMHIAVVVGLIGFLGSLPGLLKLPALIAGEPVARPAAVLAQSLMAVLTGIFVGLCVRSFILARRPRPGA
jgi:hypothetical protein